MTMIFICIYILLKNILFKLQNIVLTKNFKYLIGIKGMCSVVDEVKFKSKDLYLILFCQNVVLALRVS